MANFISPADELEALKRVEDAAGEVFTGPWRTKPGITEQTWFVNHMKRLGDALEAYWELKFREEA